MKTILLPLLYGLSGLCAYAALHHGLVALRRPVERTQLLFAAIAFLVSAYIVAKAGAYQSETAAQLVSMRRWEMSLGLGVFVILPWFVNRYTEIRLGWFAAFLSAYMAAMVTINQMLPYGGGFIEFPTLQFFTLPWGETVADLRVRQRSGWFLAAWSGLYLVMAYSVWACVCQHRRGARRKAVTFAFALGLFFALTLFNQVVNFGLVNFIHTAEFGFVALLLVMSLGLTRELRESERRMRAVLGHVPAVVYMKDTEGRYLFINRRFEELFQAGNDAMAGKTDHALFPAAQAEVLRANDRQVLDARRPIEFEEIIEQDGAPRVYESVKFPLLDPEGVPYAVCGVSSDVTLQRKNEEEMRLLRLSIWHADRVERTGAITSSL
ncbi:MAG TPA: PAS domain-containing protein, partial [Methylococcaceae bacterium]|nr:PAS domain-containing protein [Methylococcaceae bacterium]